MGLDKYNNKRNFKNTREPEGRLDNSNLNRFVVQRHKASSLHYDVRLEMGGALKSWAVPKGPSMNPEDKRLAIATEDHPVEYLTFEGIIPKGNYGAGSMSIWDEGTYSTKSDALEEYEAGKLNVHFSGRKLKGLFSLMKTSYQGKENQWLLIKKPDAYSLEQTYDAEIYKEELSLDHNLSQRTSLLDSTIKPMLAAPGLEVFNSPDWIYEIKYDGYRVIAHLHEGEVLLQSRNGIVLNNKFPVVVDELNSYIHNSVLDGEVIFVDNNGIPQFQELQNYPETTTKGSLQFMVFDLLYLNGHNTIHLPLLDRKSLLKDLIAESNIIIYCDHISGMGKALYNRAVDLGMEGIIAKKASSTYEPGYRSEDWLKIKPTKSSEAIICGYTVSDKNNRAFGSLILGMVNDEKLIYVGNCGTGFSDKNLQEIKSKLDPYIVKEQPFETSPNLKGRNAIWVKPVLIGEITFSEWTKDHKLRHPVFKGLRQDKELPDTLIVPSILKESGTYFSPDSKINASDENVLALNGVHVPISNLEKVYWPESGLLKYDLIDYYLHIEEYIVPYLKNRPQNLHRHPNGITKPGFYQKDNEYLPRWIATEKIESKAAKKTIEYLLCQNEASLLYMANLGCIEINPWHSTIQHLNNPDYCIIDLDPSEKNSFQEVLKTTRVAGSILKQAEIPAFYKTSGSTGMHIYIPLGAQYSYGESVNFAKLICIYIQEQLPLLTTLERSLKKRGPKIYLDYLQNRKGQTIVAPYSARPKPGATVSAPVTWKEVEAGFNIKDFHIKNMPQRLAQKGDLFKNLLTESLDMGAALIKLDGIFS